LVKKLVEVGRTVDLLDRAYLDASCFMGTSR